MADNKSSEEKYRIWGCILCGHNHYYYKDDYRQDGIQCEECGGLVHVVGHTNQKPMPLEHSEYKRSIDKPSMTIRPSKHATHGVKPAPPSSRPPKPTGQSNSEGKVIGGRRNCGKSSELIRLSSEKGIRILTANKHMAKILMDESKRMGLKIKPPLTPEVDLDYFEDVKEIIVDEAEIVLGKLTGKKIVSMSSSMVFKELESIKPKGKPTGTITIDLDCADALTGLKAIQREAKKATAALKELDDIKKRTCPKCGLISLEINVLREGDRILAEDKKCMDCGWRE